MDYKTKRERVTPRKNITYLADGSSESKQVKSAEDKAVQVEESKDSDIEHLHTGAGWYELPDGRKVRGEDNARAALAED